MLIPYTLSKFGLDRPKIMDTLHKEKCAQTLHENGYTMRPMENITTILYSENVHLIFKLLRINGLYMF